MSQQGCTTCGGCCVTPCFDFISPRCECCDALGALTVAPDQEWQAGKAVATNSKGQLVPFNPNADESNLAESAEFVGISLTFVKTDESGKLTSRGTNHPFAGNPCPKNRAMFWKCGIFEVRKTQGHGNLTGLDIAKAIVARGRGHFEPLGNNNNGEYKLY